MKDDFLRTFEERVKKWHDRRMGVTYKDFDRIPDLTLKAYKDFYFKEFPKLLRWFYPSMSSDGRVILFAKREDNEDRRFYSLIESPGELDSIGKYFFSVSVFFTCLIPQVLAKCINHKAMELFFRASGWPFMSAGLGGQISAELWLKESELKPEGKEVDWYNTLLDIVTDFFINEVASFLEGMEDSVETSAYEELVEMASGKIGEIKECLLAAVRNAKENFKTDNIPTYFLNPKK